MKSQLIYNQEEVKPEDAKRTPDIPHAPVPPPPRRQEQKRIVGKVNQLMGLVDEMQEKLKAGEKRQGELLKAVVGGVVSG